ncbi:MAG: hypothetical protein WAJ99_10345 [Candidatus Sulfotelmatobacter sp.]
MKVGIAPEGAKGELSLGAKRVRGTQIYEELMMMVEAAGVEPASENVTG